MRYFITDNGLETIELNAEELVNKLALGCAPNKFTTDCISDAMEENCIIFKHAEYSMEDLCYLCESTSEGNPSMRHLLQSAKDSFALFGMMTVVIRIRGYANTFYAQTLKVSHSMLDPMIRKQLIDEFLLENP